MSGIPRVLSIAGTDPTGGAGIQADLKSIAAMGGYGMAVVTALVAQNTQGVRGIHVPPVGFLDEQLRAVSDDVEIDAVKIGMLQSAAIVETVAAWLDAVRPPVVVLDPVMIATSGDRLLDAEAEAAIRALCRRADLVTPNLSELAVLTGRSVARTWEEALDQARSLQRDSGATVLLKGGHLDGADCPDAIVRADSVHEVRGIRVETRHTHGTGCSLSSAMATLGGAGLAWEAALERAKPWLTGALAHADALRVGHGNGPVDHFHEHRAERAPRASWNAAAWARGASVRADVDACAFVAGLRDGSLDGEAFRWYLAQDALYLREYSRLLARASELAPDADAREFWARSSVAALEEERQLHAARLGEGAAVEASGTTLAYLDHLRASGGSYAELVAALLPCFQLYADIGARLRAAHSPGHPYADWLLAYGDPGFAQSTARAIAIADAAAGAASAPEVELMDAAFDRSLRHELAFFEAPLAHAPAPL